MREAEKRLKRDFAGLNGFRNNSACSASSFVKKNTPSGSRRCRERVH
jgi:hypothetical protein